MTITPKQYGVWLYRLVIIGCIGMLLALVVGQYVAAQQEKQKRQWQSEWRAQEQMIITVLEKSSQELSVPVTMQPWLERCASEEQQAFETVLQKLGNGLSSEDLHYLADNFDRCGTAAADQALAQGVALEREVAKLELWLTAHTFLTKIDTAYYENRIANWQQILQSTVDIQTAQQQLDNLQRALIHARLAGEPVAGDAIQDLLEQVGMARETLSQATVQRREQLRNVSL